MKKTWISAYRRVALRLAELLPQGASDGGALESKRGKEKKRRLLAYVRDHPEELRPYRNGRWSGAKRSLNGVKPPQH
ncbi:MAG TPA: hypothetical protein VFY39_09675 [Gammaproteobacteria bacterium]|nr:hypothetical protein [Gammaproteobacteria bacterium]